MTNQADVDTLLAAVSQLVERQHQLGRRVVPHVLQRGRFDGEPIVPETVVFFTDGVPTNERMRQPRLSRRAAGRAAGTGRCRGRRRAARDYSQVGFNRADFISNKFRQSVRMIGVGVGRHHAASRPGSSTPVRATG